MTNLDRNVYPNGKGKYALVKLCELPDHIPPLRDAIIDALQNYPQALDLGNDEVDGEFFVIRIRDKNAAAALTAYASACGANGDIEFAKQVLAMAERSAALGDERKMPD